MRFKFTCSNCYKVYIFELEGNIITYYEEEAYKEGKIHSELEVCDIPFNEEGFLKCGYCKHDEFYLKRD